MHVCTYIYAKKRDGRGAPAPKAMQGAVERSQMEGGKSLLWMLNWTQT